MTARADQQKSELIDQVVARVGQKMDGAKRVTTSAFVRQFFHHVPPDDFIAQSPDNLYGMALSFWNFSANRARGETKVRVYTPTFADNGWHTPHTVVEIVTEDKAFLVDSVTAALNARDLTVYLIIHPILGVIRDEMGQVTALTDTPDRGGVHESYMHVQINEQSDSGSFDNIRAQMERVLRDVAAAGRDWQKMRAKVSETLQELEATPPPLPAQEVSEARALLGWIDDNHFTFLGYREYRFVGAGEEVGLEIVPDRSLGILSDANYRIFDGLRDFSTLPPDVRAFLRQPKLLLINKTNSKATVHRAVHMDAVFVKQFDSAGNVTGEKLFCGLLTSSAYSARPRDIPVLRQKIGQIIERAGFPPVSHDSKRLIHIIENLPRDELFQGSVKELNDISIGILHLQERQRIALFVRRDPFERFVSCLVYVPRDRFDTALRMKFRKILEDCYHGPVTAFYTTMTDEVSARVQFILKTKPGTISDVDSGEVEARLIDAARSWNDHLQDALLGSVGEGRGLQVMRRFASAFPTAYKETHGAQDAVRDINQIEHVLATGTVGIYLHQPLEADADEANLKLIIAGASIPLSDVLPILEHMGFKVMGEIPFELGIGGPGEDKTTVWVHDFSLKTADGSAIELPDVRRQFEEAVARVWTGDMEDDSFNRLVLSAGLAWRGVVAMRAYAKYLRQAAFTFSQQYMADALSRYDSVTRDLFELFETLFDPHGAVADRDTRGDAIRKRIHEALDAVESLDDDRILRRYLNLIDCTLRTNFYQSAEGGGHKPYISFKLDSQRIEDLPKPRPMVEIFVYSPRVEAVHLRGGKVARGGLRWSDRREDFRTEILGLVKAQMVKNAVIVPHGSKGGFVVKRPPTTGGREAFQAEGIECYKTFIRGMLDITDNLKGPDAVPPNDVIRRDGDDPYLVVAADKGTATFSDIANGVSQDYDFWLDDAFASGGSAGYDHKKMGITAKGAWESVKRHFREIGIDIQEEDFTCIGVGDMSGDVFGNGMLLSKHIKLRAAFNHLHILVDPNPTDAETTWNERKRLFDLPRSTWDDYDKSLISKGGGVFDRKAKTVLVTPEMQQAFDIAETTMTPSALIRALLKARCDLLWFGGIGTYIKADSESNADAGDRSNDSLRINGKDLRAKVVGEGANLGVTQLGRIEASLSGVRLNTDAVDNSAGVDCSDHEVNIKILLGAIVQNDDMTTKQRDALLEAMTNEVSDLVLRDNYEQTLAITMMERLGTRHIDPAQRFIRHQERSGRLDRANEFLPDDETLAERRTGRKGLTRPEISVLLAYAKMEIYDRLLQSDLPDEALLVEDLMRYFPKVLRERYVGQIETHRLRREIIATYVTNSMVNRTSPTFVSTMEERTGQGASEIARAYAIVRDSFSLRPLWHEIEALDNKAPAALQHEMLQEVTRLVNRCTLWFLRNGDHPLDIRDNVDAYGPGLTTLSDSLLSLISRENLDTVEMRAEGYMTQGAPETLARRVAQLTQLSPGCDVVRISQRTAWPVTGVGRVYFYLGARFGFDWLRRAARDLPVESHWHDMAVSAIVDDSVVNQIDLVQRVLDTAKRHEDGTEAMRLDQDENGIANLIDLWAAKHGSVLRHIEDMLHDMSTGGTADIAMLAVANRELRVLLAE